MNEAVRIIAAVMHKGDNVPRSGVWQLNADDAQTRLRYTHERVASKIPMHNLPSSAGFSIGVEVRLGGGTGDARAPVPCSFGVIGLFFSLSSAGIWRKQGNDVERSEYIGPAGARIGERGEPSREVERSIEPP